MSELDHKTNFITTVALIFAGLTVAEIITFAIGILVLIIGGLANYWNYRKNRSQQQYYEHLKDKLNDEKTNK